MRKSIAFKQPNRWECSLNERRQRGQRPDRFSFSLYKDTVSEWGTRAGLPSSRCVFKGPFTLKMLLWRQIGAGGGHKLESQDSWASSVWLWLRSYWFLNSWPVQLSVKWHWHQCDLISCSPARRGGELDLQGPDLVESERGFGLEMWADWGCGRARDVDWMTLGRSYRRGLDRAGTELETWLLEPEESKVS